MPIASNTDHEACHSFRDKGCLLSFPNKLRFLLSVVWRKEGSLSADTVFRDMVPSPSHCSPRVDFNNFYNSPFFLPLFLSLSWWLGQPGFCHVRAQFHLDEACSEFPAICIDLSGFLAATLFPGVWTLTVDLFPWSLSGFASILSLLTCCTIILDVIHHGFSETDFLFGL